MTDMLVTSRRLARAGLNLIVSACVAVPASASAQGRVATDGGPAWAPVQQALGGRGVMQPGDVLKFSFPRRDLHVVANRVVIEPAFALGTWLAFKRMGYSTNAPVMVMGDLVLTEAEIGPVMLALQQGGVEPTALHNHLAGDSPRVMYMHIMAHGDARQLATSLHAALSRSRTPLPRITDAKAPPMPVQADVDTTGISRALGASGKMNGRIYQVSVPRAEAVSMNGMTIPPSMGVATAINFQPTGKGKAAITGDFVMTADEVTPVMRALRSHGIQVTALHSHMLSENPRLYFMHFWANADAVTLATGLRGALDHMNVPHPTTSQ